MEFIIDTVDLEEIKDAVEHMPIVGVTSNPSICLLYTSRCV